MESCLNDLARLDLGRSERIEYWKAMGFMGRYSSVNHDIIHQSVLNHLGRFRSWPWKIITSLRGKCSLGMRRWLFTAKEGLPQTGDLSVTLVSAGLDGMPMAYRDIQDVMAQ